MLKTGLESWGFHVTRPRILKRSCIRFLISNLILLSWTSRSLNSIAFIGAEKFAPMNFNNAIDDKIIPRVVRHLDGRQYYLYIEEIDCDD